MRDTYIAQFKHSLTEVLVMLACSIMLITFISILLFVGIQGSRYFVPMSAYQISTYHPAMNTEGIYSSEASTSDASTIEIEYSLSHQSTEELTQSIEQKINTQYVDRKQEKPRVVVSLLNSLYVLHTVSGKRYVGEFVSLQVGNQTFKPISELEPVSVLVDVLSQDLSDIQLQRLQPLHRSIDALTRNKTDPNTPAFTQYRAEFSKWQGHANNIIMQIQTHRINLRLASGELVSVAVVDTREIYQPNRLTKWQSLGFTFNQLYTFLTDFPKQAGTSGGVYPAIFGTLLMVVLMAVLVTPFGAVAAIYLHEYAAQSTLTSVIRICISNMAAVPSVVYGVFGLGFFVYGLGGSIDSLLYSDKLPSPTFGTPGLLWAALTMGILTLPVVIVATEEGLSRVPKNLRAGALALGATKFETTTRVVLPMASPGILTGVILAIARAAGEVAPLILVGAVKFAPTLPIDGEFPFMHLERQFMHLGVFVYDGAFHNQTESQVSSLMFATCMMLLFIVLFLNITAIALRNRLRNKYERL
jgi:phosphate transport system permease protein